MLIPTTQYYTDVIWPIMIVFFCLTLSVLKKLWCVLCATCGTLDVEWAWVVEPWTSTDLPPSFSRSSRREVLRSEADLEMCLASTPPSCWGSPATAFSRDLSAGSRQKQPHIVLSQQRSCCCWNAVDIMTNTPSRRQGRQSEPWGSKAQHWTMYGVETWWCSLACPLSLPHTLSLSRSFPRMLFCGMDEKETGLPYPERERERENPAICLSWVVRLWEYRYLLFRHQPFYRQQMST